MIKVAVGGVEVSATHGPTNWMQPLAELHPAVNRHATRAKCRQATE